MKFLLVVGFLALVWILLSGCSIIEINPTSGYKVPKSKTAEAAIARGQFAKREEKEEKRSDESLNEWLKAQLEH